MMRPEFKPLREAVESRLTRVCRNGAGYVFKGRTCVVKDAIKALGGRWTGDAWEVPPEVVRRDPVAAGELATLEAITVRAALGRDVW